MGSIPGEIQPPPAEPFGHPALQSNPRGPGELGDLHAQALLVYQRLHLCHGDRGPELTRRRVTRASGPGGEQPPRRPLAEAEREHQSAASDYNPGGVTGEIALHLGIGQHHLHGVCPPGPPDSRLGADRAGRAVAPGDKTEQCILRLGR